MFKNLLLIGAGGAAGSMLRYLISFLFHKYLNSSFPAGTFVVNVTGCFLIGIFMGMYADNQHTPQLKLLLVTGFCGGYTTFSAFSYENLSLINNGQTMLAFGYIFASIITGVAAVWLGLKLA